MAGGPYYQGGGGLEDLERDTALTVTQFMLSPDIPIQERQHFEKFYLMFSKIMALGNIKRDDIYTLIISFEEICILLEMGLYDDARQMMGKELMKIQASRSVDGFQTLYGQQGVNRTESISKVLARQRRKTTLSGKISRAFRGQREEEGSWEQIPE